MKFSIKLNIWGVLAILLIPAAIFAGEKGNEPRVNGARVFGVRPNHPVLFKIPATGEKPLNYQIENLPATLWVDSASGIITGSLSKEGEYPMVIKVSNQQGTTKRKFTIYVGEDICLTPPMGWNSWYSWSESVSDEKIRMTAEAMVSSGLIDHGWSYINIDDCWQGERGGDFNGLQGNERFPDMSGMCDYIHSLGLKAGIYSTPWVGTYAGFRGGSADNVEGTHSKNILSEKDRNQPNQIYGRFPGLRTANVDRVGEYWLGDADAKQWAQWGFDYLKLDWKPNDVPNTKRVYQELRSSGRDIILSLSNAAPIEDAEGLSQWSNLWRTTGDIHDSWASISNIASNQDDWRKFARPGHWNDPDMLQVGAFGTPNTFVQEPKASRLSQNEQYSQMSYWALFSAPLLLSCDLTVLDEFTLSLLTNDELIDINQDPLGIHAETVKDSGSIRILVKELYDGSKAIGIFSKSSLKKKVSINIKQLTSVDATKIIDVWANEELSDTSNIQQFKLGKHGVKILRVFP